MTRGRIAAVLIALSLLAALISSRNDASDFPPTDSAHSVAPDIVGEHPAFLPVLRIPARIHLGKSLRPPDRFRAILDEINSIWLSQAGICFEMQVVMHDEPGRHGFDLWFLPHLEGGDQWNGLYITGNAISVRDTPLLNPAPRPARHPAARTAAHEFGHALGLPHRQDSDDNLMKSKTFGWQLSEQEIAIARAAAAVIALPDQAPLNCRVELQPNAPGSISPAAFVPGHSPLRPLRRILHHDAGPLQASPYLISILPFP